MTRYSRLQTCPLVILYSISANSPSKQQGGRHIVIGAMGSVDRVITLGGVGGGYIIIYIYIYACTVNNLKNSGMMPEELSEGESGASCWSFCLAMFPPMHAKRTLSYSDMF